ncbi:MAG: radical SAM protein [bacterium]|nr:radical SAM protein [bacterium]
MVKASTIRENLSDSSIESINTFVKGLSDADLQQIRERAFHPIIPRKNLAESSAKQLWDQNHEKVRQHIEGQIRNGKTEQIDVTELFEMLTTWHEPGYIDFVGLRPGTACNLDVVSKHRCEYCSQQKYAGVIHDDTIAAITKSATEEGTRKNVIFSVSGGEMLFLYNKKIPQLLANIRQMADTGAVVNMNSNLHLLTPKIALGLIESGLAKLHVSLDSSDEAINNTTRGSKDAYELTLKNLLMIQEMQKALGVDYPVLHINTVVTNKNIDQLPELFAFLLTLRRPINDMSEGSTHTAPLRRDLAPHFLFVQDEENKHLFLKREDIERYYQMIWPMLQQIWENYEDGLGLKVQQRTPLSDLLFFGDPVSRFGYSREDIEEGVERAQYYPQGKFPLKCYVLGAQAYIMPDNRVYPCGGLAEAHRNGITNDSDLSSYISPKGDLREAVQRNIDAGTKTGFSRNRKECAGCYGSAIEINQRAELMLVNALLWLVHNNIKDVSQNEKLLSAFENNLRSYLYPWLSN